MLETGIPSTRSLMMYTVNRKSDLIVKINWMLQARSRISRYVFLSYLS
jgi:hypothetical protein